MTRRAAGDIEAFKEKRDRRQAEDDALMAAALRDVADGQVDTLPVHYGLKLGTHADYQKLKQAYADALRAQRHAGAA